MVPDEPEGDDASSGKNDAAFAATVAPTSGLATPPAKFPVPSLPTVPRSRSISEIEALATVAAPSSAVPDRQASHDAHAPHHVLPTVDDGLYRTEKEIARGGMGRIVAAEDRRLGRPVALKVLIEPAGDALGRFQREALITARLQHPGIVPVYEAGLWPSGEPFFAMKLVSGKPLDRVIADAIEFEERLALLPRIASAADAIAYAHSQRIVHRDLKPGNVLIGDFGETVVIDWGLAKDLDDADSPESELRLAETAAERPTAREIPHEREREATTWTSIRIGSFFVLMMVAT